jgi:hypothetical protein
VIVQIYPRKRLLIETISYARVAGKDLVLKGLQRKNAKTFVKDYVDDPHPTAQDVVDLPLPVYLVSYLPLRHDGCLFMSWLELSAKRLDH